MPSTTSYKAGRVIGDVASIITGAGETTVGGAGEAIGVGLDGTLVLVLAPAGVAVNAVSVGVMVHGVAVMKRGVSDIVSLVSGGGNSGGSNTGKNKNKLMPDSNANNNAHSTFKRNLVTGEITNYETYTPNPKNPKTGLDVEKRYDGIGTPHKNPVTGEDLMPHVHDKKVPGNVRAPRPEEIPSKYIK